MKVFLLMVVPLSVFIAATPYTGWDIGHGFVENRDESQTHCTTWPNKANFSEFPNAKMLLDKSCSEHRRDKRVAPGVIAGGIFVLAFIGLWIRIDMVNNKVIDLAQDLASFQNMTAGRLDQLSEQEMKRLMEKMLDEDNLSAALSLFEVDYKLVLHEFGLEKAGVDGLRLLSFEVGCNANSSLYWVQICGTVNPSRKFGIVRK
uniref:Uncharacterized protein n=2 Tax=Caenorhabditis japonica TaxID=281687 RepID=A0A8R1EE38_CAEJA